MRFSHWIVRTVAFATVLLAPSMASAVAIVYLGLERDHVPNGTDQTVFVEVFLEDFDNSNEQLVAFSAAVNGIGFTPNGVRFLPPPVLPSNAHPYVFQGITGAALDDLGSSYNRFQVGGDMPGPQGVDVNPFRNGLFRIPILIPAHEPVAGKGLVLDPAGTTLWGSGAPIVTVMGPPVFWLPEPGAAGLACAAGAMLLRRRVRA
jgi:hypothetical protein